MFPHLHQEAADKHVHSLQDGVKHAELRAALEEDEMPQKCFLYMANRWPGRKRLEGKLSELFTCRQHLSESNGLILFQERLYIPVNVRSKFLERFHQSHRGVAKTLQCT